MRIRLGFVSNSSSSAYYFVPKKLFSKGKIEELLKDKFSLIISDYIYFSHPDLSSEEKNSFPLEVQNRFFNSRQIPENLVFYKGNHPSAYEEEPTPYDLYQMKLYKKLRMKKRISKDLGKFVNAYSIFDYSIYDKYSINPEKIKNEHDFKIISSLKNEMHFDFGVDKHEKIVYLKVKQFSNFPISIFNLSDLKYLRLDRIHLDSLPESIGNLKNLQYLGLRGNKLISLPESIGDLSSLKELDLSFNYIIMLPKSIGNLTNIKKINLYANKLEKIPESIGDLSSLKEISLEMNYIKQLPDSFCNLKSLEYLNLDENLLKSLPESFGNLRNLLELHLWANKLHEIPESFENLKNLRFVNFNFNIIKDFPDLLVKLRKLDVLNMRGNRITQVPRNLKNKTFVSLDLECNPIVNSNEIPPSKLGPGACFDGILRNKYSFLKIENVFGPFPFYKYTIWDKIRDKIFFWKKYKIDDFIDESY